MTTLHTTRPPTSTFAALRVRNFRLYFLGQLVSVSGTWMQNMAQAWLILQLTGSAVDLGTIVALQYVPMLLAGPYGGLIADRFAKRRILYFTQASAGLLALTLGVVVATHHATVPLVYSMAFLLGVVNLFDMPARQAFVQEMVGAELVTNAVSLNSVLMNVGRLIGPALAATIIATLGITVCFYANAASYLAVLVALFLMVPDEFHPLRTVARASGQLRSGLLYVWRTPELRNIVVAVTVVGTLAFNFSVTLPLLTRETFHRSSATTYGMLLGSMGLGAIIGGLYVARRAHPTQKLLRWLAVGFGLSMALVAVSPNPFFAGVAIVPMGAFSIAFVATANAMLQLGSPPEMRGRVMSLYSMAFMGTTPIGGPLIGFVVALSSPRVAIALGALATLLTGLFLLTHRLPQPESSVLEDPLSPVLGR